MNHHPWADSLQPLFWQSKKHHINNNPLYYLSIALQVFDQIRTVNPKQLDKIKPIRGDVSVDSLGISADDEQTLISNVTVVFHCAANVRFDQQLKDAVNLNTLGTKRVITLAEKMPNLKVFVHVSTAYCQCNEEVLEERAYKAPHNPLGIATMSQLLDNEILDALTPRQASFIDSMGIYVYWRIILLLLLLFVACWRDYRILTHIQKHWQRI